MKLATLLSDPRVEVLLTAAQHAHTALSFDVSLRAQRRAAENLELALKAFETEDRETLDTLPSMRAAEVRS